jgi:hypothetical protein
MYAIGIRLTFRGLDETEAEASVEGVGLATAEFNVSAAGIEKKATSIAVAQKQAKSAALRNAFDKVIRLFPNSNTFPDFPPSVSQKFFFFLIET